MPELTPGRNWIRINGILSVMDASPGTAVISSGLSKLRK